MPSNSTRNKKRKKPTSLANAIRNNCAGGQSQETDIIEIVDDDEETFDKCASEQNSNRCLITLENEPVSHFQVLRLLPDEDKEAISQLEYAWGMKPGKLSLDVPTNEILLKTDFGTTLNSGNWALVPTLDVLHQIAAKTLVLNYATKNWPVYLEWFPIQPRDYQFIHFVDAPKAFLRFSGTSTTKHFVSHEHPFHNVPLISSRLHPYFAICDVAIKAERQPERKIELHKLQSPLRECVDLCLAICKQWFELHRPGMTAWRSLASPLPHVSLHPVPLDTSRKPRDSLDQAEGLASPRERGQKGGTRQTRASSVDSSDPRYPKRQRRSIVRP